MLREGRYEEATTAYAKSAGATGDPALRAEASLGLAIARFELGDREASIAALREAASGAPAGSATARRAGYLLGLRLNEAGRYAEAATALKPLAGSNAKDALQPYIAVEFARALSRAHDARAEAAWAPLLAPGGLPEGLLPLAYLEQAEFAKEKGDLARGADWRARAAALTGDPADRYVAAGAAQAAGDTSAFAALLRAIVADSPSSKYAPIAIADLRDAGFAVDPAQEGLVAYRRGAYAEAQRLLERAVAEPAPGTPAASLAFTTYYLGAAYEDGGKLAAAVQAYDRVPGVDPTSPYAHRARYWAARTVERMGDARDASVRYVVLATGVPGEFTSEAGFRAGYVLYAAGDPTGALAAWATPGLAASERLLYWKGRAMEATGDASGARGAFVAAAEAAPLGFYGMEAARRIGRRVPLDVSYRSLPPVPAPDWPGVVAWLSTRVAGSLPSRSPTAAGDLLTLGLRAEAADLLWAEAARASGAWALLSVVEEAEADGLHDVAAQLAVRLRVLAGAESWEVPPGLLRVAYPLDFAVTLDAEARKNGLDPLFLAAVVRQESFWEPSAESHAGALGLTQVMPATGDGIALALDVGGFTAADLLRPAVSLRFGAYYLGGQAKRFADPLLALAGYNAGPGNAQRWAAAAKGATGADLLEVVDIAETNSYVQYIIEHYAHYEAAYR